MPARAQGCATGAEVRETLQLQAADPSNQADAVQFAVLLNLVGPRVQLARRAVGSEVSGLSNWPVVALGTRGVMSWEWSVCTTGWAR